RRLLLPRREARPPRARQLRAAMDPRRQRTADPPRRGLITHPGARAMDLHAWITQQVDRTEVEAHAVLVDPTPLLRRCEADRRILARHNVDPAQSDSWLFAAACHGCGTEGDCDDPVTDNLNDCPEL